MKTAESIMLITSNNNLGSKIIWVFLFMLNNGQLFADNDNYYIDIYHQKHERNSNS